jgi:hypothetical protein
MDLIQDDRKALKRSLEEAKEIPQKLRYSFNTFIQQENICCFSYGDL